MADLLTLQLQAGAGDARAQTLLAWELLLAGKPADAVRLLDAASAQKFPAALLQNAALAALGFGRPRNLDDSLRLLREAAATGEPLAKGQLSVLDQTPDLNWWLTPAPLTKHHDAPRIFTAEGFMPKAACDWLMRRAKKGGLSPSMTRDHINGGYMPDPSRTNTGCGFGLLEADVVIQLVCLRLAITIGLPLGRQETTNILRYERGQQYKPHYDFITPKEAEAFGAELAQIGQRVATFLVYLNDGYEGGETAFPHLDWKYKGNPGDALIFWNLSEQGVPEPASVHAGTPVTKGEKWLLSKWLREKPIPMKDVA